MVALIIKVLYSEHQHFSAMRMNPQQDSNEGASGGVQWFSVGSKRRNTWQVHGSHFPGLARHPSSSFVSFPSVGRAEESGLKP